MVDLATAEHHGVCPKCEGYCGNIDQEGCPNEDCQGSCAGCWCPGCHDGQSGPPDMDAAERAGSWEAYQHVQALAVIEGQLELDAVISALISVRKDGVSSGFQATLDVVPRIGESMSLVSLSETEFDGTWVVTDVRHVLSINLADSTAGLQQVEVTVHRRHT